MRRRRLLTYYLFAVVGISGVVAVVLTQWLATDRISRAQRDTFPSAYSAYRTQECPKRGPRFGDLVGAIEARKYNGQVFNRTEVEAMLGKPDLVDRFGSQTRLFYVFSYSQPSDAFALFLVDDNGTVSSVGANATDEDLLRRIETAQPPADTVGGQHAKRY